MHCLKRITFITIYFQGNTGHSHDYQVAIVGGGMAGLAAASSLSEAGFDVVLFEAADYLGKERLLIFLSLDSLGQHYHISSLPLSLSLTLLSSSSLNRSVSGGTT